MGITAEIYEAIVKIVDDRMREIRVTREDFNALKGAVEELTKAQQKAEARLTKLEEAVAALAEAQRRTEERITRLEEAVTALAEAQRRTEERITRLEEAVTALAEAQKRTEERITRLEEAVTALAEAQKRTELAVQNLAQQVGKLSDTVGYGLEDVAKVMLPAYLERHYKVSLKGPLGEELERRFFQIDGVETEVNLYGEGEGLNGEKVFVICECKSRIHKREVEEFEELYNPVRSFLEKSGKVFAVLFGYWIHPTAIDYGKRKGILLVASYQR